MAEPAVHGEPGPHDGTARARPAGTPHPLDPLSAGEVRAAAAILRRERGVDERWRFASIELREPSKETVRAFTPGDPIAREAEVICWNREDAQAYKARVALGSESVVHWEHRPGEQPNMTADEFGECDVAMRRHPRVIEALAARGITDMDSVLIDTWAYGAHLLPEPYDDRRLGWADVWYRAQPGGSPYAHPVTGLHLIVDLNRMELLEVEDTHRVDEPRTMGEYLPRLVPGLRQRDDLRPLEITQPEGTSFTLEGNLLRWQKWSLRVGFNHREGMVLHTLAYEDDGPRAPGRAPAVVRRDGRPLPRPDARPLPPHRVRHRRVGARVHDHLARARAATASARSPTSTRCCTTRAASRTRSPTRSASTRRTTRVLWKHVDAETGAEVRRRRRLVVSFHVTVANYEYLVYWRLYQDGNIECEVRATGIMVTTHFDPGRTAALRHARRRADLRPVPPALPRRPARPRRRRGGQHGPRHAVRGAPGGPGQPARPRARGARAPPLRTEEEGKQDYDWHTQRAWKVVNTAVRNGLGTPVAYKLVPGGSFPPMLDPDSPVLRRAAGHRPHAVGHALRRRRALAVRRVRRPERAATSGCRSGPRRTARSRTPTSCSGTSSASTTSRAPRSGR